MEILNWIWENKEWFFSGLGIAILSIIFGMLRYFWGKRDEKDIRTIINQDNSGTNVTQIGVQNNYYGKDASDV